MAQVGRISGPLLQANLERNGIDLAFETDLLYFDVNNGRIGIKNNSPSNDITVSGTSKVTDLQIDTEADIGNLNFQNSTIESLSGSLFLTASANISSTRINTDDIDIDNNVIKTYTADTSLEIRPNGTGETDVFSDVFAQGNMHATGDITVDGNVVFGNSELDSVTFDSDIASDLIPDQDLVYDLGSSSKRWFRLNAEQLNGEDIDTAVVTVQGLDLSVRQDKLYYVSTNGDNSNDGDHQQSPFRTIDYAVTQASAGDTIYVYPGEYEETTPINVPKGVSIVGHDMRNTVVSPPSSANSNDIFWVNGEVTIENLTVKDFFYDNINDTGYAFRFAPNTEITSRSPYIKNVSVITSGSNTTAEDPRGFDSADAGKGALVDGVEVLDSSIGASMLFHAATFITPGVDALTMTNGVRVEWLNSFTYFANRGIYAKNGPDGWLSTDGSTVRYGAELRSIGSANVYGNFGVEADGEDTLVYLIMHNFSYIGSGKDVTNDNSLVKENQQTVELNNGNIRYQSTDQLGKFKVGDNFFVDFETGSTSVNVESLTADSLSGLIVKTDGDETFIIGNKIETGNVRFTDNSTLSLTGDYNINSASGVINLEKDTNIENNLDITDNFSSAGSINLFGNQPLDTVTFNTEFSQDLDPFQDFESNLGSIDKEWLTGYFGRIDIDGISIFDNQISSKDSNADLELKSAGAGTVDLQSIKISDNTLFTVSENMLFENQNTIVSATGAIRLPKGNISQRIDENGNIGDIRFNTELNLFEGYSQTAQYFGGVYSENSLTNVTASNNNEIDFVINQSLVAQINSSGILLERLDADNLIFDSNSVVSVDNNDILFSLNGTGNISVDDIRINTNTISNISNGALSLDTSENGYVKINSTAGFVIPVGDESNKGPSPETGEIRWNTELETQEVYTGSEWISPTSNNVTSDEMLEIIDEWSLILG